LCFGPFKNQGLLIFAMNQFDHFRERFKLLEKKIQEIDELRQELKDFRENLNLRVKRNEFNTKKIIDEYLTLKKSYIKKIESELADSREDLEDDKVHYEILKVKDNQAFLQILKEKSLGFPWLSSAWSDYVALQYEEIAKGLVEKSHPALKAAEVVRLVKEDRKKTEKEYRISKYLLRYYETLFPWLIDFRGEDLDDLIRQSLESDYDGKDSPDEEDDPAKKWLTAAEYKNLLSVDKYQLALERYWKKRKSPWEIGRDYERYIGYLYEKMGYQVYYQGILKGFDDLGRDLICRKGEHIKIIQCKCWSQSKGWIVRENHINQLFGTTVMYCIDKYGEKRVQMELFHDILRSGNIVACLYTSTILSDTAKQFSNALGIEIHENFPSSNYPSIKCNISQRTGERIYHLPFDQQYDRTIIEEEKNECYVETVAEAEALGFRHAFRWQGQ